MKYYFDLFVIHVSGERMIQQGTDGLSRGALRLATVERSSAVRLHVPLNQLTTQRSPKLVEWIKTWIYPEHIWLQPENWFVEAYDLRFEGPRHSIKIEHSTYIWTPPPAIADVALEQLREAKIKWQQSFHVMLIPHLFFGLWRRQLYKAMDIILFLPLSFEFWDCSMHEPLIIAFAFPYLRCKLWTIRETPKLFAIVRKMQALWKEEGLDGSSNLREFLLDVMKLPPFPEHVVCKLLYFALSPPVSC